MLPTKTFLRTLDVTWGIFYVMHKGKSVSWTSSCIASSAPWKISAKCRHCFPGKLSADAHGVPCIFSV